MVANRTTSSEEKYHLEVIKGERTYKISLEESEASPVDLKLVLVPQSAQSSLILLTADQAAHRIGISRTRFDKVRKQYGLEPHSKSKTGGYLYLQSQVDLIGEELALEDPALGFRLGWKDMMEGNTISATELLSSLRVPE
jgi:hypothetical protein